MSYEHLELVACAVVVQDGSSYVTDRHGQIKPSSAKLFRVLHVSLQTAVRGFPDRV